jgi:rhodanese-related sulfurtransferase
MLRMSYEEFVAAGGQSRFRLLDVRETEEFEEAHVTGAELFPLSRIRREDLPEQGDRPVAIICRSGGRSALAAQIFEQAGWPECVNIEGGTLSAISLRPQDVEM